MTEQLREKFKRLRLAAEMKERDEALAMSAVEKARRAEEAARDGALDGAVKAFKDELEDAVALLADVGIEAHVDGATLVAGTRTMTVRRVGLTVVIEENGRPAGMIEFKKPKLPEPNPKDAKDPKAPPPKEPVAALLYLDGKPFEGIPERLAQYLNRLVTELPRR